MPNFPLAPSHLPNRFWAGLLGQIRRHGQPWATVPGEFKSSEAAQGVVMGIRVQIGDEIFEAAKVTSEAVDGKLKFTIIVDGTGQLTPDQILLRIVAMFDSSA